ncbi:MAG: MCE family protein [Deltaproteobacteria bacterium]|nr:MCE family protein [Deltaproteobacteria bacterium]
MTDDLLSSENISDPEFKSSKGISPIWILPMVALIIAGWLIYKSVVDAGINVVITFATAQGIEKGKTRVLFRGTPVGLVKDLAINKDFKGVDVQVEFVKSAKKLLAQGTRFWMVEPRISTQGITGLETILRGNYIAMMPGKGEAAHKFTGLSEPPPMISTEPGFQLQLTASNQGSLTTGSMVYFKGIEVGRIRRCALGKGNNVIIDVFIRKEHAPLLKKSSRFYRVSGITLEGGLSGFKIRTEALSALLKGGIAFFTPGGEKGLQNAQDGDVFLLFENKDAALQEGSFITLICDDGMGISDQTFIKYRGLEIGRVSGVNLDQKMSHVVIKASIQRKYQTLIREGTKFWLVKPKLGLANTKNLETLITGTYFTLNPGKGKAKRTFTVLGKVPEIMDARKGLQIILEAERLGSIKPDDPVYFRQIKVGKVTHCRLSPNATSVSVGVDIESRYAELVRRDSKFWKASGIDMSFGLFSGAKVKTESLEALLEGGIAFATPEKHPENAVIFNKSRGVVLDENGSEKSPSTPKTKTSSPSGRPAAKGDKFILHNKPEDEWLKWRPAIMLPR